MSARRPRPAQPWVSVVVLARNEARNLEIMLPALAAVRPAFHEIIVVDGCSVDGTAETAQRVLPAAKVITQTRTGKGNALACGFAAATGDLIVMFDADGSADPAEIPAFVAALVGGADFAKGTRFTAGGGSDDITPLRSAGNAGLNLVGTRSSAPAHRPVLRLQRLLVRHPPGARPPAARRALRPCCGATASRSRPSSTAASRWPG